MERSDTRLEPVLVVSDTHIPYHDVRAWNLMLKVGRALKPKHLITIGDLLDFYAVSSHSKNPLRTLQLRQEIDEGNSCLDQLDALGARHKIAIGGNHSDRLQRYLYDKAPELFEVLDVPKLLHYKERGWHWVPYKDDVRLGKCYLTHDVGSAGRNAVFKALDTYQHSIITGHTHRLQYIVEGNAAGEVKLSAQFGWLGDVNQIDYMHKTTAKKNWALGFGIGYLNPRTKYVYMTPVPIIDYTCVVNGRLHTN